MARFIAIPKENTAISMLSMAETRFSKGARINQIKNLKNIRKRVKTVSAQMRRAKSAFKRLTVDKVADFIEEQPITGIAIFKGKLEDLDRMRDQMPDYDIIEDAPLSLVPPIKSGKILSQAKAAELDTWHLEAVQVARARLSGFAGRGKGIGVAILDTGVKEVSEISGRVRSAFEYDEANDKIIPIVSYDTHGHGTHVAGLVAGKTVGIAPEAELMNYVMIPGGTGNISDFIRAIEFIALRPEISVMSMSAGIPGYHSGMETAVKTLRAVGVLPIVAIGNEGRNTSRSPGNYVDVVSVGASNKQDKVANFSSSITMTVDSQSYTVPDLVSPGQDITSCVMGGGYESWNGTSMATPIVSGLAALVIEKYPNITEIDLQGELHDAVRFLPAVPPIQQGDGLAQLPSHMWFQGA